MHDTGEILLRFLESTLYFLKVEKGWGWKRSCVEGAAKT